MQQTTGASRPASGFWYRGTRDEFFIGCAEKAGHAMSFLSAGAGMDDGRWMMEEGMRRKKKNAPKVARFKRIMYLCSGFRRKEEIMCTCIAEIKASYTKVRHQTAEVAQQQFDIDDYLDKVIVVRKKLEQITEETNSLVETVRDHFTEFDVQETTELLAHSTPILILMDQLHQKLVESPLYPGLKTAVENYCDCVSIFQELCSDLQTFNIDIPRNEKSREVEELLRKLA